MKRLFRPIRRCLKGETAFVALALASAAACSPEASHAADHAAVPTARFLNSIGIVTTFPERGQPLFKTISMINYCGFRWVRGGIEGLTDNGPTTIGTFLELHKGTGALISWGLVSGGTDIDKLIRTGKVLAEAGALLAFEGNNEPNNWGVEYKGEKGGGQAPSWMAVAKLQRDLYRAVKSDPVLKKYPVWSISEPGAEKDNVGLQFLKIPPGAGTLMPDGTEYADYANVHNYVYHPSSAQPADNKTWNAADPTPAAQVDGLYGNFGRTWGNHYAGYSVEQLKTLPRVTTETGVAVGSPVTEEMQGKTMLTLYLDQFKQGYSYTSVYLLRDRTDEDGNQAYGFFTSDYRARLAATYLHNLTTILKDSGAPGPAGTLDYTIPDQTKTVHDLLLQRSDKAFQLIVWNERVSGRDVVPVDFGREAAVADVYDPTVGTNPVQSKKGVKHLDLSVSDHPLVVILRSEAAGRP